MSWTAFSIGWLTLLFSSPASSQADWPEVHHGVKFVNGGDEGLIHGRLTWAGQKSTADDELDEVMLKNDFDEDVTGFQVGWVLYIPDGCGVTEDGVPRREVHLAAYREGTVAAGQTVKTGPYHLSPESIRNFARHAHSPAVVVQAAVVRLRFANGGESVSDTEGQGPFMKKAASYPCEAYQKSADAENALKTFFGSEFRLQYASLLIPCERKVQGDSDYWAQASCNGYGGVCDEPSSGMDETIACFAYPKTKFADTPTFQAAAFAVATVQASNEKGCISHLPGWENVSKPVEDVTIHGVKFHGFEFGEGGMSQSVGGRAYSTWHNGKCYRLSISEAMVSSGAFDPGVQELSPEDLVEIHKRLEAVRDSFEFMK
ncbi:MAG TPA: hypothetical protein VMH04_19295 [Candidatus Solibacter sp.]|nr:hypothetical protein [Candidatus Solibacter sp.]